MKDQKYFRDLLYLVFHSPFHNNWQMNFVKTNFVPPFVRGQYRIWYCDDEPVGCCVWAWVTDEILEKLKENKYRIRPEDWSNGKNLWFQEFIAPFGKSREMVRDMRKIMKEKHGDDVVGHCFRPSKQKLGKAITR